MDETMSAADVLEQAADLLLVHGRSLDFTRDPRDGSMCVRGALAMAATGRATALAFESGPLGEATNALWARVGRPSAGAGIVKWNTDADDDEVRDTLLLCAKNLRNEATA